MNHHARTNIGHIGNTGRAIRNYTMPGETIGDAIERARRAHPGRSIVTLPPRGMVWVSGGRTVAA